MPDLQSELAKITLPQHFDDEDYTVATHIPQPTDTTEPTSKREMVWQYIRKHPMSTTSEIGNALDMEGAVVSNAVFVMFDKGLITRKEYNGAYQYTTAVDAYPRFDRRAHGKALQLSGKLRYYGKDKTKPKQTKKQANKEKAAPQQLVPQHFDVDQILSVLSVVQARQLLNSLKILFGDIK